MTPSSNVFRLALGYSAVSALVLGLLAMFAPATFYADFPFFASWVDNLPPYSEHVTTDTLAQLDGYPTVDAVGQTLALATLVAAPLLAVATRPQAAKD